MDPRLKGLDAHVRRWMKSWKVPGLVVGVVERGRPIHVQAYGLRDIRRRLPVTEDTLLGIASCTKAFTATAAAILVDEGLLDWDRPVREVLPTFRLADPVATERTTVRDLLTHRTGLPRHDIVWVTSAATRQELMGRLRHLEPNKDFRSLYQYNNLMYMAAGAVIEHASGMTWEAFVRERILQPLGMTASGFWADDFPRGEPVAQAYEPIRGRCRACTIRPGSQNRPYPIAPAGAIVTNVGDLCRWVRFQMDRGRVGRRRIVSERALKELHTPHVVVPSATVDDEVINPSYGMGWNIQAYRGRRHISHGGAFGGYGANVSFMPGESLGVVVMANLLSPLVQVVPRSIYDRLLGLSEVPWNARFKRLVRKEQAEARKARPGRDRKRGTRPSHPLADYVGEYRHPGYGGVSLSLDRRRLTLRYNALTPFRLRHYHYDVFELIRGGQRSGLKASFTADGSGRIASVAIPFEPTVTDIVFQRPPDASGA